MYPESSKVRSRFARDGSLRSIDSKHPIASLSFLAETYLGWQDFGGSSFRCRFLSPLGDTVHHAGTMN